MMQILLFVQIIRCWYPSVDEFDCVSMEVGFLLADV
jgi:hypothetical protein